MDKAVERGTTLFAELKKDSPELRLHPVFLRFGPCSGQFGLITDLRKIVMEFPEMLAGPDGHEKAQGNAKKLHDLLFEIMRKEKTGAPEQICLLQNIATPCENPALQLNVVAAYFLFSR